MVLDIADFGIGFDRDKLLILMHINEMPIFLDSSCLIRFFSFNL